MAALLLARGVDVNAAATTEAGAGSTPLDSAARAGKANVVRFLIENGATVNAVDGRGQTHLFCGAGKGKTEVVKLLLAAGADPNIKDKYGTTPAFAARLARDRDLAALLGADIARELVRADQVRTAWREEMKSRAAAPGKKKPPGSGNAVGPLVLAYRARYVSFPLFCAG